MVQDTFDYEVCQNALAATEATIVVLTQFDSATCLIHNTAWAGHTAAVVERALAAVHVLFPGWHPGQVSPRADTNDWLRRGYLEGQAFVAPLAAVAEGTAPKRIVEIAGQVVGMTHVNQHPLVVNGAVDGALVFFHRGIPADGKQRAAAAFARVISLTRENARLERLDGAVKTARLVAHELNNKLAYTLGYGELLIDVLTEDEPKRYAQAMTRGAADAAAIVDRLQRLIRFEERDYASGMPMLDLEASVAQDSTKPR